jgi:hypothetical protein
MHFARFLNSNLKILFKVKLKLSFIIERIGIIFKAKIITSVKIIF